MAIYDNQTTAVVVFAKGETAESVKKEMANKPNGTLPQIEIPNNNDDYEDGNVVGWRIPKSEQRERLKDTIVGLGVIKATKSIVNYAKNNYGDIMQDSVAQTRINEAFSIVGMGASIGMGFATGGLIGGVAMIGAQATSLGLQALTRQRQLYRSDVVSQVNMFRIGDSAINGGR